MRPLFSGKIKPFFIWLILLCLAVGGFFYVASNKYEKIYIGMISWVGYESFWLASQDGSYDKLHAQLHVERMADASQVQRYCRAGAMHLVCLTMDEALHLKESNPEIQVIALLDISRGADVILSHPSVSFKRDAEGRLIKKYKIGFEKGAVGEYMLRRWLEIANIKESEVELVDVHFENHEQVFLDKKIDMIVTFSPIRESLLSKGAQLVFSSSDIEGEIADVLVAEKDFIDTHKEILKDILRIRFAWVDKIKTEISQQDGKELQKLAAMQGISMEELKITLNGVSLSNLQENKKYLKGREASAALKNARHIVKWMGSDPNGLTHFIRSDLIEGLDD